MFVDLIGIADREEQEPAFTIQEFDIEKGGKKYKSLYKLFMESVDEYDFATTHLGGLHVWEQLVSTNWFYNGYRAHRGVEAWREDLRARDESLAKKAVMLAVREGDINAAKKLWDKSKKPTETKRGRFKKEEVIKEAVKSVEDREFLDNAALRLNVVNIMD